MILAAQKALLRGTCALVCHSVGLKERERERTVKVLMFNALPMLHHNGKGVNAFKIDVADCDLVIAL